MEVRVLHNYIRTLELELASKDALLREALADLVPKPNRYPNDLIERIRRALEGK